MGGRPAGGEPRRILPAVRADELARLPLPALRGAAVRVDQLLRRIVRASEDEIAAIEAELVEALQDEWTGRMPGALDAAIAAIEKSIVAGTVTEVELAGIVEAIRTRMVATDIAAAMDAAVGRAIGGAYGFGREGVLKPLHLAIDFNLVDEHAQKVLKNDTLFWVGGAWDRTLGGQIADVIRERVIEQGLGRKDAAAELERIFAKDFPDKSRAYWEIVASAGVVRARTFGAVESFVQAEVETYRWLSVEDARTCATCGYLDGRIFTVASAVRMRDTFLAAEDPEAAKAAHPWAQPKDVVGKTTAELVEADFSMPPIHGRCRCDLVVDRFQGE